MTMKKIISAFFCLVLICSFAGGAEYIVDSTLRENGAGRFRTISDALAVIVPGDTVIVRPGEYHENINLTNFYGDPEKPTVIKAELPQSVVLRGSYNAPIFRKSPSRIFTYTCVWDKKLTGIMEYDTFTKYRRVYDRKQLENDRGVFFFDPNFNRIMVVVSDGNKPDYHTLKISTESAPGIYVAGKPDKPVENIHISGFVISGFMNDNDTGCGIKAEYLKNCTFAGCIIFANDIGVNISNAEKTQVRKCRVYGNQFCNISFSGEPDKGNRIFSCHSSHSHGTGIIAENVLIEESISNDNICDIKGNLRSNSVAVDELKAKYTEDELNEYFADPENNDFRLQENVNITDGKTAPGNDVFFISSEGNDENSGRSVKNAWRSFKNIKPNSTVYLLPGVYPGDLQIEEPNVKICTRGVRDSNAVIIGGRYGIIVSASKVEINRISFVGQTSGGITIRGRGARVYQCGFSDSPAGVIAADVSNVVVAHCAFDQSIGQALRMSGCSGTSHSNIFMPVVRPIEGIYSNYNSFQANNIPKDELYTVRRVPKFVSPGTGNFDLENADSFHAKGLTGLPIGPYRILGKPELIMENLQIQNNGNSVTISWITGSESDECEFLYTLGRENRPDIPVKITKDKCRNKLELTNLNKGIYSFVIRQKHGKSQLPFATGGRINDQQSDLVRYAKFMIK